MYFDKKGNCTFEFSLRDRKIPKQDWCRVEREIGRFKQVREVRVSMRAGMMYVLSNYGNLEGRDREMAANLLKTRIVLQLADHTPATELVIVLK